MYVPKTNMMTTSLWMLPSRFCCTPAGARTLDTLIKSQVLYQLSYKRIALLFCGCKGSNIFLVCQTFHRFFSKNHIYPHFYIF